MINLQEIRAKLIKVALHLSRQKDFLQTFGGVLSHFKAKLIETNCSQ